MHTRITAKAVIFNEHGEVLVLRRSSKDEQRAGEQDFPGGGIEENEQLTAGVSREIYEEAGIGIHWRDLHLFYTYTESYKDTNIIRLVFWGKVNQPTVVLSHEHQAYRWVAPDQVSKEFPHPVYGVAMDYGLQHGLFAV